MERDKSYRPTVRISQSTWAMTEAIAAHPAEGVADPCSTRTFDRCSPSGV